MKSIELTKEHKSKLLEMCNKLFPEYKEIILTKQKFLNFGFKDHKSYTTRIGNMSIHWFEFCMTHLAEKILDNSCGDISTSELGYFSCGPIKEIHPVNYLYEEFKKLKL